jgi:long-chain acyl-CoA synthetase
VRPDEPVIVRIGNRPIDIAALLGVWQAGAVVVPAHVAAAPATVTGLLRATGARISVDSDRVEICGDTPPAERPLLREAALVMFTSGSTGQPKGVVVGHERLARKLAVLDRLLQIRAGDAVLVPLQLTFIFGLWVALLTLRSGARLILVPRFSGEAIARGIQAGATVLAGVPSMYRAMLADPALAMPSLRMVMTGGEVMPKPLALAMRRAAPNAALVDLYGLTETGTCDFMLGPADQPDGFGSIGAPTETVEYRIEADELQIRSPFGMLGYLDNPALTAASFDGEYFKTGDLARLRADGRVELIGRSKDIVSRGGNKIAPLEIDNLLCEHPDVAAALCAGVPDERLGEVIHAVIVPRAGAQVTPDALRAWMLARTERFKVPDAFHLSDSLPAGATGKADRRAVAALAQRLRSVQQ